MACYSLLIYFISFFSLFVDDALFAVNMVSTASQVFLNCWMRATASIVRAKRCYSDDMLNNLFEYSLPIFIICASCSPSFHLLFLLFLLLFTFSSYTGSFRLQSETALPAHCYDRFPKIVKNHWKKRFLWLLGYLKVSHLWPRLWVTF